MPIDLTPFEFTPTENLVYGALLELGPASGYAVAKQVCIARANAYQALNGLVTKGAAVLLDERPRRFRAVQAAALLSRIADRTARQLDRLEAQVADDAKGGAPALVPLVGLRSLSQTATRTVVRAAGTLRLVAPADLLVSLVPALRKRQADGHEVAVWSVGPAEAFPIGLRGELAASDVEEMFGATVALLSGNDAAICAVLGDATRGYWTSDPLLAGLVRAAVDRLVA